jgi:tRNA_anti-like
MGSGFSAPPPTPPPPSQPPHVRLSPNPQPQESPKKPIYKRWWFIVGAVFYGLLLVAMLGTRDWRSFVRLLVVGGYIYAAYWVIEQKTRIKPWAKHLIVVPTGVLLFAVLLTATGTNAEKAERERHREARIAKEEAKRNAEATRKEEANQIQQSQAPSQQPSPSPSPKPSPQTTPQPPAENVSLDDNVIKIAQIIAFNAHFHAALGQNYLVSMSREEALGNLKIAYAIDARALTREYSANEVAADQRYKRKRILVTGVVSSINKGLLLSHNVVLAGHEFMSDVTANFSRKYADTLADLRKGESVNFVCDVSGVPTSLTMGGVELNNCSTFGAYANTLRSDNARRVADALSGKVQVSKDEAQRIARIYVMAAYFAKNLPQDSSCFRTQNSACNDQMDAVNKTFQKTNKTDAWKKDSNAKMDTLVARMNVG